MKLVRVHGGAPHDRHHPLVFEVVDTVDRALDLLHGQCTQRPVPGLADANRLVARSTATTRPVGATDSAAGSAEAPVPAHTSNSVAPTWESEAVDGGLPVPVPEPQCRIIEMIGRPS